MVALAVVWLADGIVLYLEFRKKERGAVFWSSLAGVFFLGILTVADAKQAQLEGVAEAQQRWRRISPEQHTSLVASLRGHPIEVWVSFVGADPEAAMFHADIEHALKVAGLKTKFYSGWERAVGLSITDVPGPDHDILLTAFRQAGLRVLSTPPPRERFQNQLMVIVGSKPPPE